MAALLTRRQYPGRKYTIPGTSSLKDANIYRPPVCLDYQSKGFTSAATILFKRAPSVWTAFPFASKLSCPISCNTRNTYTYIHLFFWKRTKTVLARCARKGVPIAASLPRHPAPPVHYVMICYRSRDKKRLLSVTTLGIIVQLRRTDFPQILACAILQQRAGLPGWYERKTHTPSVDLVCYVIPSFHLLMQFPKSVKKHFHFLKRQHAWREKRSRGGIGWGS